MATIRKSDLAVFDGLSIVKLDGFEPEKQTVTIREEDGTERTMRGEDSGLDLPGSANWLVSEYGLQSDDFDPQTTGIIWTDYDGPEWRFSVLIASDEVEDLKALATEAGYEVRGVEEIAEPTTYGDGQAGTVTILKHPDGWCILS